MSKIRQDDLLSFVEEIEGSSRISTGKLLQRWEGEVVIKIPADHDAFDTESEFDFEGQIELRLLNDGNDNWEATLVSNGAQWAWVDAAYTVKGANADDAERHFSKLFNVPRSYVRVSTKKITPVTER